MSADNFVALLQTKNEFRVMKAQCFENLLNEEGYYSPQKVYDAFSNTKPIIDQLEAGLYAEQLENEDENTEYGIFVISFSDVPFESLSVFE